MMIIPVVPNIYGSSKQPSISTKHFTGNKCLATTHKNMTCPFQSNYVISDSWYYQTYGYTVPTLSPLPLEIHVDLGMEHGVGNRIQCIQT